MGEQMIFVAFDSVYSKKATIKLTRLIFFSVALY